MSIQQHPLPQDISSYRFRLIGDMTIKQFASLGISIIVGIIVYSLPLPFFFRYPLSFLFVVLGIGMAFVPVQGRSLDVWILAFIRSIYSPTQYIWKKSEDVSSELILPTSTQSESVQAVSNSRVEITTGLTKPTAPASPLSVTPATSTPSSTSSQATISTPITPPSSTNTPIVSAPISPTPSSPPSSVSQTTVSSTPQPALSPTTTAPTTITPPTPLPVSQSVTSPSTTISPTSPTEAQLPIPFTPSTPNTLVGLTLTPSGRILEGVLVEIQKAGLTYRATKSNKLGQFMFARPLENGTYQILAEKEDFSFSPYSIDLTGEIVKPLKIQAQK